VNFVELREQHDENFGGGKCVTAGAMTADD